MAASGPQLPLPVQSGLCFDIAQRGHHQRHRDRRCGSARGHHYPVSPARSPGGSSSPDRSTRSRGCPGRRCWGCRRRATAARDRRVSVRRAPRVKVLAAAWGRGAPAPAPRPGRRAGRAAGSPGTSEPGAVSWTSVPSPREQSASNRFARWVHQDGTNPVGGRSTTSCARRRQVIIRRASPQPGDRHDPLCRLDIGECDRADPAATPRRRDRAGREIYVATEQPVESVRRWPAL